MEVLHSHQRTFQIIGLMPLPNGQHIWKRISCKMICIFIIFIHVLAVFTCFKSFMDTPRLLYRLTILFQLLTTIRIFAIIFTVLVEASKLQRIFDDFQQVIDESKIFYFLTKGKLFLVILCIFGDSRPTE